jgi:arylsulfatase A-like enzyme
MKAISILLSVFCCLVFASGARAAAGKPNVVIILADDLGYGDVHADNPESKIPTPNMDRLAAEGMRFTDAHTPSAVCTPTRYGLLTGRYCWRTRLKRGVLFGYSGPLVDAERRTIGHVFRDAGYATACVGKWHLGMGMPKVKGEGKRGMQIDWTGEIKNGPETRGFDHYFGVAASLDMAPYTWIEDGRFTEPATEVMHGSGFPAYRRRGPKAPGFELETALDTLVDHGNGWIKKQAAAGKPFLLYLPLTAPHKPVMPAKRFQGKSGLGAYGDFILAVDDAVGRVLGTLAKAGVADNTLVVLTSDNGSYMCNVSDPCSYVKPGKDGLGHVAHPHLQGFAAKNHRANYIYKGTKTDAWDGGHRVPFVVRWPGKTPAGKTCSVPVCLTDIMATSADLLGQKLPDNAGEDSFSILPLLLGKELPEPRPAIVHHSISGAFALRDGRWKVIFCSGSGGRNLPRGKAFDGGIQLYDMEKDPSETTNVADRHPEVVKRYTAILERFRKSGRSR